MDLGSNEMRNVEIKARIDNVNEKIRIAKELSGEPGTILLQHDVFFNVNKGRLKLRKHPDETATLVRYDRKDQKDAKLSTYSLQQLNAVQATELLESYGNSMGIKGEVKKKRVLFMVGQTRIHIDMVEDLGNFLELEVVLEAEQTLEDGKKIACDLQNKLGISEGDLIDCAYLDMLLNK